MKYLRVQLVQFMGEKKKTDDLITAPKCFHREKVLSTGWLVNIEKKGIHKTNQHLEADAKFK